MTQADLARRAGIRSETLSRLERGKYTPDMDTVDKIIRVLERVEAKPSPERLGRLTLDTTAGTIPPRKVECPLLSL